MRGFSQMHPIALAVYYLSVILVTAFYMNPVFLCLSLFGSLSLFFIVNKDKKPRSNIVYLAMFVVLALVNPLVSHNGVTVLFVLNNNPITLESLIYGVFAAVMILASLYWLKSFVIVMTDDKILAVIGAFAPKTAVLVSMSKRFVPLFVNQFKKTNNTQKIMGLEKDNSLINRFKSALNVFSITSTWALENGIITADSMESRGYGIGKRTNFSNYRFKGSDALFIVFSVLLLSLSLFLALKSEFSFYPVFYIKASGIETVCGYLLFAAFCLLPSIIQLKEDIKWKYLKSKI